MSSLEPTQATQPTTDQDRPEAVDVGAPVQAGPGLGTGVRPGRRLTGQQVRALQPLAGNAAVARLVQGQRAGSLLSRDPAPAPAAQTHAPLTADDRKKLDDAKMRVDHAKVSKDTALEALSSYSNQAPGLLRTLKETADKNVTTVKAIGQKVNFKIAEAKEIAKIQEEVLTVVVSAALGGVTEMIMAPTTELEEVADGLAEQLKDGWKTFGADSEAWKLGDVGDKAKGALGGEGGSSDPPVPDPWAQQIDFYKSYAELQSHSTHLLGIAVNTGRIGEPIGRVDEAIAGILNTGTLRTDYPLAEILKDAATLENSSRGLAGSAPRITNLLAELQAAVALARAAAPKDDMEVEKGLWKKWAAGLGSGTDYKDLDLDVIENYLTKIGIWKELGIDIGNWFSSDEQILAVGSARAQEMVTEKRESVVFGGYPGYGNVKIEGLPGSPTLRAHLDQSSTVFTSKVRAVVIGARAAVGESGINTDVLKQIGKTKDGSFSKDLIAEYLLNHEYIEVVLRGYEDLSAQDAKSDSGGSPPPPPAP